MPSGPPNGRSCDTIRIGETATGAAKRPMAIALARLPACTQAIAISVSVASATTPAHFTQLTRDWLMRIRWRRASRAFSLERHRQFTLRDDLARRREAAAPA